MTLTVREREVCELVARGKSNKEIAMILGTGDRTIEDHRRNAYRKLDVCNAVELIRKLLGIDDEQIKTSLVSLRFAQPSRGARTAGLDQA